MKDAILTVARTSLASVELMLSKMIGDNYKETRVHYEIHAFALNVFIEKFGAYIDSQKEEVVKRNYNKLCMQSANHVRDLEDVVNWSDYNEKLVAAFNKSK